RYVRSINTDVRARDIEPAVETLVVTRKGVLVLSIQRINCTELHRMAVLDPRRSAGPVLLPREVVVRAKALKSAKAVSGHCRDTVALVDIRQVRVDRGTIPRKKSNILTKDRTVTVGVASF